MCSSSTLPHQHCPSPRHPLLASQPNTPSDRSHFQLAQHQVCCPRHNSNLPLLNSSSDPSARHPPSPPLVPSLQFTKNPISPSYPVSSSNAPTSPSRPTSRGSTRLSRRVTLAYMQRTKQEVWSTHMVVRRYPLANATAILSFSAVSPTSRCWWC
jgi:hypothetical protein